ncbi:dual specificity protein phosphatase family protein [Cyanobium sp. ATX 6F1]|uniref:dual specificity protein phosphatase family protein n=1 Tax=unclassified Cyanobium TaxID=2627006 RepID=UPI0020CBCE7A|nr:dual specificity protein phosphatase [Cyanobium sp. ATX 6F1]MCP9917507.1 dual specificity protein phosphatase family protein [Cyanobium sp. ATX 6F1]
MSVRSRFRIDWVLRDELALGPAPQKEEHLELLEREGVRAVLSLCDAPELPMPQALAERFLWARQVLPDHRSGRNPTRAELEAALAELARLRHEAQGPVFVHCVASMERSPLVCLAWLMRERGMKRLQALDYLMQLHPGTNPLPGQLGLLE